MADENKILTLFTTRMRQMILQYQEVKKENAELLTRVDAREKEVEELKKKLEQAQKDYNSLKMARMIEVSDGDIDSAKKRLATLIRAVNRCITLLCEK